jgi:hypothetical protein
MRQHLLTTIALGGLTLAGAGWAGAQSPPKAHHEAAPAKAASGAAAAPMNMGAGKTGMGGMDMGGMKGDGSMCPMMGGGMGMGMGGGMGAMMSMGGPDTQVAVKNTDKGVTITLTTSDPAKVARLQKMAEAMRLMHEAQAQ